MAAFGGAEIDSESCDAGEEEEEDERGEPEGDSAARVGLGGGFVGRFSVLFRHAGDGLDFRDDRRRADGDCNAVGPAGGTCAKKYASPLSPYATVMGVGSLVAKLTPPKSSCMVPAKVPSLTHNSLFPPMLAGERPNSAPAGRLIRPLWPQRLA